MWAQGAAEQRGLLGGGRLPPHPHWSPCCWRATYRPRRQSPGSHSARPFHPQQPPLLPAPQHSAEVVMWRIGWGGEPRRWQMVWERSWSPPQGGLCLAAAAAVGPAQGLQPLSAPHPEQPAPALRGSSLQQNSSSSASRAVLDGGNYIIFKQHVNRQKRASLLLPKDKEARREESIQYQQIQHLSSFANVPCTA